MTSKLQKRQAKPPKTIFDPLPDKHLIRHLALLGDDFGFLDLPFGQSQRDRFLFRTFLNSFVPLGMAQKQLIHISRRQVMNIVGDAVGIPKFSFFGF